MIYDTHIHSNFSSDCDTPPEELITAAEKLGYGVIFTEHHDPDFVVNDTDFRIDADTYIKTYEKYKKQGALTGIEIGITDISRADSDALARKNPFDFVLGAVHMVDNLDIYIEYIVKNTPSIAPEDYLAYVRKMTEYAFYDSLAHIDYPHRYAARHNLDFSYDTHKYQYDQILRNLTEQDVCIEINTNRLSDEAAVADLIKIYQKYAELGGMYVTIGSDAHTPAGVGKNFDKAFEIARYCGLMPVYFIGRKKRAY